jgi:hypothetical protein
MVSLSSHGPINLTGLSVGRRRPHNLAAVRDAMQRWFPIRAIRVLIWMPVVVRQDVRLAILGESAL